MGERHSVGARALFALIWWAGCGAVEAAPPERHENALASVDEMQLHALIVDDDIELTVPVQLRGAGPLDGTLRIQLQDVQAGEPRIVALGSVAVSQTEARAVHRVRLLRAANGLERTATGPIVIDWRLDLARDDLFGKRSLYAALGSLEVQVRGPTELPADGASPLRVVVRDPRTRAPVAGAEVVASFTPPAAAADDEPLDVELFRAATDARGELLRDVALPEGADGGSIRVSVLHDDAQVWTTRRVSRRADGRLYLGSDKTLYKPGQDIHLRLLALDGADRRPAADRDVVFEARDARGNKVFRRRARTDAFGVAAVRVPTDTRVNEGDWVFGAELDGRHTELRLPVRRYELPRMRVAVSAERAFAVPGDTVRAHVEAAYLFGEPVTSAAVTVEARTTSGAYVASASGTTDADGRFDLEVVLPEALRSEALEENGDTLLLSARVVDSAAQTELGEGRVPLAAAPLRIHLVSEALTAGEEAPLWVLVTDPLGRPLRAAVELSGVEAEPTETSSAGLAELRIVPPAATLSVRVTARDGAGRAHERTFALGGRPEGAYLAVRTDRALYHAGEVARVELTASSDVTRVYLDVYRGAVGVRSTVVDLDAGRGALELPIPADAGGLLVLDAFALTGAGESVRASRPLVVERDDQLRITLATDRETYAPGDEAQLSVQVADATGAPQVASVGLAVVDEAVFALGGEPGTTITRAFGLDTRALPSGANVAGRGADDILATPDAGEREQLARVLFATAGGASSPVFDYNSVAEELPRVRDSLQAKLLFDAQRGLEGLRPGIDAGWVTASNVGRVLRGERWFDPFGRPYRLTVEGSDPWSLLLEIRSDGPDETTDTADDVTARTSIASYFGGYDYASDGDGEAWAGGGPAGGPRNAGAPAQAPAARADADDESGGGMVRTDFRETAFVQPTLVTDASGRASVAVPLAHSITTWRVSAEGSDARGSVGSGRHAMRTFQDFFVDFTPPTRLTRGDVVELPAVVYNYLDHAATVAVTLDGADWIVPESPLTQSLELGPSEVRAVRFRVRVARAGQQRLSVRAVAGAVSDALVRSVEVTPDGQPEDQSFSGVLEASPRSHVVTVPSDTVEGGSTLELALTPGFAAEAVSGVESLLHEPNGCFEQTTSSAWPNTLVAGYLESTGQMTPEKREEIIGLVTRGYQRLLTFESPTGGFNWWGDADPGNRILSAIMLWHLKDLESLIEIDTSLRDRTLDWLVAQQRADGAWEAGDALHAGNEVLGTSEARTTAFIAWALAHTGWADDAVERAAGWLRSHMPPGDDLYANALAANALALVEPHGSTATDLFARLDRAKVERGEQGVLWPTDAPSWTGAAGDAAAIETTGLVAYALMRADAMPDVAAGAMRFILANKDSVGTWYNTQATMNALRALSAAASGRGPDAEGTLLVSVNGEVVHRITLDADNRDLYRRFDLGELAAENDVRLELVGSGSVSYRLTRRAFRPVVPGPAGPLSLEVEHDTTRTGVGAPVLCTARAHNGETEGSRDQVIVQIGRAPGFEPMREDLESLVASGAASRYEVRDDDVTFYLMGLAAGESRELRFRLVPGIAVEATAPASSIYAYYEPALRQTLSPVSFVVEPQR